MPGNVSKQLQCIGECLLKKYCAILNLNLFLLFIKNDKVKFVDFQNFEAHMSKLIKKI